VSLKAALVGVKASCIPLHTVLRHRIRNGCTHAGITNLLHCVFAVSLQAFTKLSLP
jgi:hypothetical protein